MDTSKAVQPCHNAAIQHRWIDAGLLKTLFLDSKHLKRESRLPLVGEDQSLPKMKLLLPLVLILSLCPVRAADQVPTDASMRELLEVAGARKLIDGLLPQIQAQVKAGMVQGLRGHEPTPAEQKMMERILEKVSGVMKEELAWSKLEPIYFRMYRQSLSQEEIDGMLAFYKTPAGQAMIKKLPLLMTSVMSEMQGMMGSMMTKVQGIVSEAQAEMAEQQQKPAE